MRTFVNKVLLSAMLVMLLVLPATSSAGDYVIGDGDVLQIAVWGVASLDFAVKVRPDGIITVPGLGEVMASGQKPRELQDDLTEKLKELVKNPIVTVTVVDISRGKVYIFGSGIKSGVYDIDRKATLLQVLCSLADLRDADLDQAYLLRDGEKIKDGFSRLFIDGDVSEDIKVESNDAIFIPLLQDKSIYVLGAVATPKAIPYREGITVLEAILEAGGFTKFAGLNDTEIVRKQDGKEVTIPVKMKKLLNDADLGQNVKLMPGDYVIARESLF